MAQPLLVVRSRRVVTDTIAPAAIHVRAGRIEEVAAWDDVPAGARLDDLGELAVLPGIVDTHVHLNEPGRTEWEGFATATRAAAVGGVTTLVDMPLNSIPPTTTREAFAAKRGAASWRAWSPTGCVASSASSSTAALPSSAGSGSPSSRLRCRSWRA